MASVGLHARLPRYEEALIPVAKLRDYLLDPDSRSAVPRPSSSRDSASLRSAGVRSKRNKNLPDLGLKRGDVGAVVEIYAPDALEVEFVRGSGETQALVTLKKSDVRRIGKDELLAVRPLGRGRPRRPGRGKKPRR